MAANQWRYNQWLHCLIPLLLYLLWVRSYYHQRCAVLCLGGVFASTISKFLTSVAKPRRVIQLAHNTVPLAISESCKSK
jgi:hypothetical protein